MRPKKGSFVEHMQIEPKKFSKAPMINRPKSGANFGMARLQQVKSGRRHKFEVDPSNGSPVNLGLPRDKTRSPDTLNTRPATGAVMRGLNR